MGNTMITSVCRREELVDFEDISDATFDFISVAVHKDDDNALAKRAKQRVVATASVQPFVPANKMVSVVPVSMVQDDAAARVPASTLFQTKPKTTKAHTFADDQDDQDDRNDMLSFNDRLNMLTWDPENLLTHAKRQDMFVFDEYAPCPINAALPSTATKREPSTSKTIPTRGWIRRAVANYKDTKTRTRRAKTCAAITTEEDVDAYQAAKCQPQSKAKTKKRTLRMTLWGKREHVSKTTTKDKPCQLSMNYDCDDPIQDDDETERFLTDDEDSWPSSKLLSKWDATAHESEPVSDTESEDCSSRASSVYATTPTFATHFADEFPSSSDDESETESEVEWARTSSTSSCYFSAADDRDQDDKNGQDDETATEPTDESFFSSSDAFCARVSDYLCECSDCPRAVAIERAVTNSNCWMNEQERRSLCRMLQAYTAFYEPTTFHKGMIASAEECLLVFHGDEHAAFNALVLLDPSKWV